MATMKSASIGDEFLISICLCTYRRPELLTACLESLLNQSIRKRYEVIVTDNDAGQTGRPVVAGLAQRFEYTQIPITYLVEPCQNIALARNRGIARAAGKYVAFIDDDERASFSWLENLLKTMTETSADAVWGPVEAVVPETFPEWLRRGVIFENVTRPNGCEMGINGLATNNALVKTELLRLREGPFDRAFGRTGGEDTDLFHWIRRTQSNIKYFWSAEATVYETIESKRREVRWHVRRAYRGGVGLTGLYVKKHGRVIGGVVTIARVVGSIVKGTGRAFVGSKSIKECGLRILINISANAGKLGYFFRFKIEEYQG